MMRWNTEKTREVAAGLDLRNLLALDHSRLEQQFDALIATFESDAHADAARMWSDFAAELQHHFALEEKHVFPEFAKVAKAEVATLAYEHAELRDKLRQLCAGVNAHITRAEAIADFIQTLRLHAKREDALVYRWAQANLSPQTQASLRKSLARTIHSVLGLAKSA